MHICTRWIFFTRIDNSDGTSLILMLIALIEEIWLDFSFELFYCVEAPSTIFT